jgi:hypothetical protein
MYTADEVITYFKDNIGIKKTRKRVLKRATHKPQHLHNIGYKSMP